MAAPGKPKRGRGRPKKDTESVHVRLPKDLCRDLDALQVAMWGKPELHGIIEDALREFIPQVLKDQVVRGKFDAELNRFDGESRLKKVD